MTVLTCATVAQWHREFGTAIATALRGRNHAERGDALQELWQAVLQAPPQEVLEDDGRLLAWLIGAARRRMLDRLRHEKRRRQTPLVDVPDCSGAEREGIMRRVHDVLAMLSAGEDREAAQLLERHFIDGERVTDIARDLGASPNAVSARLQRAKRKFRAAWLAGGD